MCSIHTPSKEDKPSSKSDKLKTIAIQAITNLIQKYTTNATNLIKETPAIIQEIVNLWQYIPEELKGKAFTIVKSLWGADFVLFSSETKKAEVLVNFPINDPKLSKLRDILPYKDRSIITLSVQAANLHNRGLHFDSEIKQEEISERYRGRGKSILHLIRTGDIGLVFQEFEGIKTNEEQINCFNWWVRHYLDISILVASKELDDPETLIQRINKTAKKLTKPFMLFHLAGSQKDCNRLYKFVEKLKKSKTLNYIKISPKVIMPSGWCKSLSIRIDFPDM